MSLINEALKKAQRARAPGTSDDQAPVPGGGPIAKRGQSRSANTMVLLGSAAVVLVVLSVVATIYFVNRPAPVPAPAPVARVPAPAPAPVVTLPTVTPSLPPPVANTPPEKPAAAPSAANPAVTPSAPVQSAPASPPAAAIASTPTPPPAPEKPAAPAAVAAVRPTVATPTPAATPIATPTAVPAAPPPVPAPATPPAPRADERIAAFVESLRIAGVRASGAESRVLINERVYRVNDIVDRNLGLRLIKVTPGNLTFADQHGLQYVKNL